ncbi:MAG: response regulator SirA [Melioribacteraceae bacterium]|nr:response regulator SirA [Melioribacteraceae bacterium]
MHDFENVLKRSGAIVPFKAERISNAIYRAAVAVGGRDKELAESLTEKVIEYLHKNEKVTSTPDIEQVQDAIEKVLIENGHAKVSKAFILYREERNKKRQTEVQHSSRSSASIPWRKIWHGLDWAVKYNLNTYSSMNRRIQEGEFPIIVHESEKAYENDLETVSEEIISKASELKVVLVSGPSASGKTTTTLKLEQKLKAKGYKFKALEVDHYFFDLELHPKDEFGDYDFETPQALDLDLINDHLDKLCKGQEVKIPYYDFKNGKRHLNRTPIQLEENEILLIDSLHGLFPKFSEGISVDHKFRIYIEPLIQMKGPDDEYVQWTDIRLMRRMLRDAVHRAYNPKQTLEHWHYVRSSELRNIMPYIGNADYIVSSAMPYELALYGPKLQSHFAEWAKEYKNDPLREDAYMRANRINELLSAIVGITDESSVPKDSVLREFIGGSIYTG